MSVDAVSYEELQQLYHAKKEYADNLFAYVGYINAGRCSPEAVSYTHLTLPTILLV